MRKQSIIKEIHDSFSKAEETLLQDAKKVLACKNNKEKYDKLSALGFTGSKNVRSLSDEEIKKAEDIIELQKKYTIIAPKYRFITEAKRIELCKKYGIVLADVERFTGDIPEKNVQDIIDFRISDESYLSEDAWYEEQIRLLREKDPIVLAKVKGGYLIVTAWGDEATDDLVFNHINN